MSVSVNDIRRKYLEYMTKHGHAVIPSASLVPDNDPTTLFTGSGMQPLIPFLMGESHPKGTRLVNSQKCFRAEDIDEVGDNRHTTFFEMLGNWSLGDYFKQEQLGWFFDFLTKEVGLDPSKLYVTVYQGDAASNIPKDEDAAHIWQELFASVGVSNKVAEVGSEQAGYTRGMHADERIFYYDSKNWWSRTGTPASMPVGEIGGGDSEVFFDFGTQHDTTYGEHCHPNCDCGRFLEIANSVFMEYVRTATGFEKLPKQNVDFGGGLERIAAAANGDSDVFLIDVLYVVIKQLETLSGKSYQDDTEAFRVITDHIRGATFMIGDGVNPSNSEQGYFVRRLLRRAVRFADKLGVPEGALSNLCASIIEQYQEQYASLQTDQVNIMNTIAEEERLFRKTLENGLKQFNKISLSVDLKAKTKPDERYKVPLKAGDKTVYIEENQRAKARKGISATTAFELFTTYGFPIELTEEIAAERGLLVDRKGFEKLMQEHKEKSRAGAEQKFKGGLADHSKKVVQYHTSTHLLLAALRNLIGPHIHQAGSNITGERLRFDFTHSEKIERFKLDELETWVNNAIQTGGNVVIETMSKSAAEADPTIEGSFWERYPDQVKVYSVIGNDGTVFSRELCGGPHVERLEDIEGTFKIQKEESSSAGVRRIKAILE